MSDIEDKIAKYLMIEDDGQGDLNDEDAGDLVFDMMVDLLSSIDPDSLSEFQADMLGNILDEVERLDVDDDDDDDEDGEDVSEKRIQKISRKEHITLKKDYKRNKAKFKLMNKMFRKTSAFKVWKKKHKRLVKAGRTKTKKYV